MVYIYINFNDNVLIKMESLEICAKKPSLIAFFQKFQILFVDETRFNYHLLAYGAIKYITVKKYVKFTKNKRLNKEMYCQAPITCHKNS